ncbi:MAG: HAMP domain-containing sensor histidine kinase [Acidovorax sp.]|uniref:HAMP domain-containing sensor histidine kinase n=1 Tax=Acidovorax sp. TaxID=1872122 RepID=UPI00261EA7D4|nr:HAMP domain-containing sensor histidine kinase [Acidovorax sp.]MDH4425325.1 HAMP domain-containing sensor histidine kinase [Acidovorax sp.]
MSLWADGWRVCRGWPGVREFIRAQRQAKHALVHSLRVRLIAMFVLLALAMAATFMVGMQVALSIGWRDAAKPLVADYIDKLAAEIGDPPDVGRARAITQRLPLNVRISGPQTNWRSNPEQADSPHDGMDDTPTDPESPRFYVRTTADGHRIQFGVSVQAWHNRPRFIGWLTLFTLLVLTTLAYVRVRRMLRPLDDIRAGALRFGAGEFGQAIPVRSAQHPDELGELAATINTMGADIHQMLEAKRTLLLAISHELRSPLTRARLHTELLPETVDVQPSRQALLRDLALMRDLVTDLLESERLASPHAALHREAVDVRALVDDVVCELHTAHATTAQAAGPTIDMHLPDAMPRLPLDPVRMRLLVRNLLDNALRHSASSAVPPQITVQWAQGQLRIAVRDFGTGVDDGQLPQLGQPFFRADAARTREGGGVGLGLYLCRLVAQAHGGQWAVRNAQPGLQVEVTIPA